jgi:hypothetical protein
MGMARRLLLPIAVLMLPAVMAPVAPAAAQTLPWPSDPKPQGAAPWPGERSPPQPGMASPGMASPAMASPGMSPMMASPRPMGPGMGGGGMGGGGGMPPCMAEFTKLREDVEKKGQAAKAAGQKHASREEMCKLITSYAASEAKWVKFTETGVGSCGIPPQVANQLKQVHANTEQTREKICTAGPAGGGAPSLSEALGTTRVATPDASKTAGSGLFDTLTGSAVRP